MLLLCLFLILGIPLRNKEVTGTSCDMPLGMQDGRIKDDQLLSKGDVGGTFAKDSRIEKGSGWCSRADLSLKKSIYDPFTYLQVDLLHVHKITKLRVGGGSKFVDYVPGEFAKLSYRVNEKSKYIMYKDMVPLSGVKHPATRDVDLVPPIIARYLKYQPQVDSNPKCMTMEIYGCPLHQSSCRKGILNLSMRYNASSTAANLSPSYITPDSLFPWGPGRKSRPFDESLDVDLKSLYLITGVQTFQPKYSGNVLKQPDSFVFKYRNNDPDWIAYTGGSSQTVEFNTSQVFGSIVTITPTVLAKHIRISPEQSEKRYMKMQFYGCLMSDPTIFGMKTASPPTSRPLESTLQTTLITKGVTSYKTLATKKFADKTSKTRILKSTTRKPPLTGFTAVRHFTTHKPPLNAGNTNDRSSPTLVIVIVILVVIIVLIIILFLVCLYRGRTRELPCRSVRCGRKSGRSKANGNQGRPEDTNLLESLSKNPIYQVSFKKGSEVIGHLNAENGNEMIGHLYDEASNKQRGHLYDEAWNEETGHLYDEARNEETSHLYAEVPGSLVAGNDESKPLVSDQWNSRKKESSAVENIDHNSTHLDPIAHEGFYTKVTVETNHRDEAPVYADAKSKENVEVNPIYDVSAADDDAHIYERAKGLSERAKIYEDPYQNVTGSSLYADPDVVKERTSFEIRKFPRERLRFLEKIGTGQFGEVYICEVDSLGSIVGSDAGHCSWIMSSTIKVAVKMLKSDVEKDVEKEFMKEVRVMARLQHENVVMLLGVCDEDPKCMVVEYMENGDLNQFLKSYSLTDGLSDVSTRVLNEQTLLYMCLQICGGMKYLSSQGFVHRDLATRNCLVGHSFTVKISDFGMSRYLYSKHYYRIEGRAVLPIRWMAPESLFYGTFTSESDVWACGVTLWEIFTFARETPYELMSDQQVIENACSIVAKEQHAFRCLPHPPSCSDHIYRLLLSCWKKLPNERPNFNQLTQFFQRLVGSVEASI